MVSNSRAGTCVQLRNLQIAPDLDVRIGGISIGLWSVFHSPHANSPEEPGSAAPFASSEASGR